MSLFVEGGARVNGTFLQEQAFNQVIVYIAPKLIGCRQAPTPFAGEGWSVLSDVPSSRMRHVEKMGNDLKIIATIDKGENDAHSNRGRGGNSSEDAQGGGA